MKAIFLVAALAALAACDAVPRPVVDAAACAAIKAGGSVIIGGELVDLAAAQIDLIEGCD